VAQKGFKALIESLKLVFGFGSVGKTTWNCTAENAKTFLTTIQPFVVGQKEKQIQLILHHRAITEKRGEYYRRSQKEKDQDEDRRKKVKAFKHH